MFFYIGIADYLIQLPGIDINMRDDQGRTVLMNMMVGKSEYTGQHRQEIKRLVEIHGADCQLRDNEGRNVLHHLASPRLGKSKLSDIIGQWDVINDMADFFMAKGVSAMDQDTEGKVPVVFALSTLVDVESKERDRLVRQKNIKLIHRLIQHMTESLSSSKIVGKEAAEQIIIKIMEAFVSNIELCNVTDDLEVFKSIIELIKLMQSQKVVEDTEFLDTLSGDQSPSGCLTIFESLCRTFTEKSEVSDSSEQEISTYCQILNLFIRQFSPSFTVKSVDETREDFSVLLHAADSRHKRTNFCQFAAVVEFSENVDVTDTAGRTALTKMIENQSVRHIETLLARGADVNKLRVFTENEIEMRKLPIESALETGNIETVDCLLRHGANRNTLDITGSSLIHQAVSRCARSKTRTNLQIVKLILADSPDLLHQRGENQMTPLHAALMAGEDDADQSLDLETFLLRSGANVNALDGLRRTPLHYAFLSREDSRQTRPCDPIQIVSLLVESMEPETILQSDVHGCTALHYAALRGATVTSLLLIQRGKARSEFLSLLCTLSGAAVDCVDLRGNTPLGYAVLGRHQGCALMLVQREANINVAINRNVTRSTSQTEKQFLRFLPQHFSEDTKKDYENIPLFEGLVSNNWLGLTYIALDKLELSGFSLAKAVEVAFKLGKFQFAKTLLGKAFDPSKLQELLDGNRNLIGCLSLWCRGSIEEYLITDIFDILRESGLSLTLEDEFQCSPLHYAAFNKNRTMMELLLSSSDLKEKINQEDKYGRTPLAAFFYNYSPGGMTEEEGLLDMMIKAGAKVDTLFPSRPLDILQGKFQAGYDGGDFLAPPTPASRPVSPLMVSVVLRDVAMVSYLLARGASLNTQDRQGRSAAMLAVKTRDLTIIQLLVKHRNCLDLSSRDCHGHGLLDHAIALDPRDSHSPSFTDMKVMKQVMRLTFDKKSLTKGLTLAKALGSRFSGNILGSKDQKRSGTPSQIKRIYHKEKFSFDHRKDSQQMMKIMEEKMTEGAAVEKERIRSQAGCVVKEGSIYQDYDVLMNKVDVDFGCHGMYNFYRLQIWKEKHKELYVLFTNWGRIERWGRGQHQNTPFSTADLAVQTFCKIFKAKSGNEWADRHNFVEKPKKYRIIHQDFASNRRTPSFDIELTTDVESRLPLSLQKFVKDISDVNMLKKSYWKEKVCDSGNIPFERISGEVINKADRILDEIEPLIKEKERFNDLDFEKKKTNISQLGDILERISKLSNEYYFLVPSADFSFEKVPPVDKEQVLKDEKRRLRQLRDVEVSKSVVLGSMLRRHEIHPLDYIFSSLNCHVETLEEDCLETRVILQYLYNSRGMRSLKVEEIFKVQRNADKDKHQGEDQKTERKLLWHGTSLANIISILSHGLLVTPPSMAARTGRRYGDGLYFADVCDKSWSYSSGGYILLCDVQMTGSKVTPHTSVRSTVIISLDRK